MTPVLTPAQIEAVQAALTDNERIHALEARIAQLVTENAALYRLSQFGDHRLGCPARMGAYRPGRCRCGFVACEINARLAVAQAKGRDAEGRLNEQADSSPLDFRPEVLHVQV